MVPIRKPWGQTMPMLREPHLHVDEIRVNSGGFSSLHYHRAKVNWFILGGGSLAVSVYSPASEPGGQPPVRSIHYLSVGVPFAVAAGVLHRFACLDDCECTEVYWPPAPGVLISEDDIVRLSINGLEGAGQLAEGAAWNCMDGLF